MIPNRIRSGICLADGGGGGGGGGGGPDLPVGRKGTAAASITLIGPEEELERIVVSLARVARRQAKSNPESGILVKVNKSWE